MKLETIQKIQAIALALLIGAGIGFMIEGALFFRAARRQQLDNEIPLLATNMNAVLSQASSVLSTAQQAALTAAETAVMEKAQLKAGMRELNKTLADTHDLVVHLDTSLNGDRGVGGLVNDADASVRTGTELLTSAKKLTDDVDPAIADFNASGKAVRESAETLSAGLTQVTPHIVNTSKNLDDTSVQLDTVSQDGRKVADHYTAVIINPGKALLHDLEGASDWLLKALQTRDYWPW